MACSLGCLSPNSVGSTVAKTEAPKIAGMSALKDAKKPRGRKVTDMLGGSNEATARVGRALLPTHPPPKSRSGSPKLKVALEMH